MRKSTAYILIAIIIILLILLFCCRCCRNGHWIGCGKKDSVVSHWINWNLAFDPSTTKAESSTVIQNFENYLTSYVHGVNPDANLTFKLDSCPCDALLTNIDATLVYGSGNSVSPPKTTPKPGVQGNYVLGNNLAMSIADSPDSSIGVQNPQKPDSTKIIPESVVNTGSTSVTPSYKLLAVIDTGLDSAVFNSSFPKTIWNGILLWQDPVGATLFDVIPGEPTNSLIDKGVVRHGTSATWIALKQIINSRTGHIPQIMSIRAFDDSERGTIFSASCALSYAIQHNADYINASWGYFGDLDSVLRSYLIKASNQNIRIIAAAGNTPGRHSVSNLCNNDSNAVPNTQNWLDRLKDVDSLFYPACLSSVIPNLVSVTQMNIKTNLPDSILPCYYQNYSSKYITVGALEPKPESGRCCSFTVPFLIGQIEGSSFATPAITGKLMSADLDRNTLVKTYIITNSSKSITPYTNLGDYFPFTQ